jgi:hypothetical protein
MGAFGLASILAPLVYAALTAAYPTRGFDLTFAAATAAYMCLAAVIMCVKTPPPETLETPEGRGAGPGEDRPGNDMPRCGVPGGIERRVTGPGAAAARAGGVTVSRPAQSTGDRSSDDSERDDSEWNGNLRGEGNIGDGGDGGGAEPWAAGRRGATVASTPLARSPEPSPDAALPPPTAAVLIPMASA